MGGYEIENHYFKKDNEQGTFGQSIQQEMKLHFAKEVETSTKETVRSHAIGIGNVRVGRNEIYPFIKQKLKMMSDFQTITETRVDLIFTENWLKYHMIWFFKENNLSINFKEE